jgi:capsular exopolysaccharide synthesis family protein
VASELHLEQRPEFRRVLSDPGPGILVTMRNVLSGGDYPAPKLDAADLIATDLRRHLKADRLGRSALVRVAFTAGDPELAANVANAIAGSNAVDAEFRERLSVTERAGFDLLRAWVVSPASVPLVPSSPNVLIVLLGTLVAALGAAFSAVLFADYYATRMVVSADQIARRGMRALGFIPVIDRLDSGNRSAVTIVSEQPSEAFSDSIAALRASLVPLASQSASNCLVLLFASALQAEGKSTTVAALAASIASSGDRVLLIDADLRSPTLHKAFGACAAPGLSNGLDPDVGFDSLIQIDSRSGVSLLTAGSHHPRPLDVLTSARFHEAISKWRNSFDFILIDAPPVLGLADARVLVPSADYCVFVVRWGKTGWEAINHGLRLLTEAGAKIAGVAVSRINSKEFAAEGFPGAEFYSRFYREHERMGAREAWPRCDA